MFGVARNDGVDDGHLARVWDAAAAAPWLSYPIGLRLSAELRGTRRYVA
jgi:hypothetical protein